MSVKIKDDTKTPMASISLFIVVSLIVYINPTAAKRLETLKPIAVQNGSQLDIDDIDLTKMMGCGFFVFAMNNFQSPWTEIEMSRLDGRYYPRSNGLLTIRSIDFSDGGLLRLGCPHVDFLQFLIVFDVVDCQSNVSAESGQYVEVGERIQTTCEFRYSTGLDVLTTHWTAPIQWKSDGQFEDCSSKIATKEGNTSSAFVYKACVIQTASAPEVSPVSCSLSYRDFRQVFRHDNGRDSSTIWKSDAMLVWHPVGVVRVEQVKTLIQTGNSNFIQTFTCTADGFPRPTYRWLDVEQSTYVDGPSLNVTVHQGNRLFAFTTVIRYVCVASNSFNEMESTEIRVSVPTDLPHYVYVIAGIVLVVVLVSVFVNVIVGCRATAKRRQKQVSTNVERLPTMSKDASSMNSREMNQRYSEIQGRAYNNSTAAFARRDGQEQRTPMHDQYAPLNSNGCEVRNGCPTNFTTSTETDGEFGDLSQHMYERIDTTAN